MSVPTYYVGLDLDLTGKKLTACIGTRPWKLAAGPFTVADSLTGFGELVAWLQSHHCSTEETVLCMPATGFLGEPLAYYMVAHGYRIAIERPIKIKRPFAAQGDLETAGDSRQVAEYAYRFSKQLQVWQPSPEILSRVRVLLDGNGSSNGHSKKGAARSSKAQSRRSGEPKKRKTSQQLTAVEAEIRDLVQPRPTITDDWPCY